MLRTPTRFSLEISNVGIVKAFLEDGIRSSEQKHEISCFCSDVFCLSIYQLANLERAVLRKIREETRFMSEAYLAYDERGNRSFDKEVSQQCLFILL